MQTKPYDLIVVGKNYPPFQRYLSRKKLNYLQINHKNNESAHFVSQHIVIGDLSSDGSVNDLAAHLSIKADGLLNIYEPFTMASAWLAKSLSIAGMPESAAQACSDKYLMRRAFDKSPIKLNPPYAKLDSWLDALDFIKQHGWPAMIKPRGLAKSLLISRNDNLIELKQNFKQAMSKASEIYARFAPTKQPAFIIEGYMEGSHHTVQAFADKDGRAYAIEQVVDQIRASEVGYDDNFIYARILPSRLSSREQAEITKTVKAGIKAIGMKNALAHCDVVLTNDGPRLIEIGARIGGFREFMYREANGINIYDNMISLAYSQPLKLKANKQQAAAVIELFPKTESIFKGITNQTGIQKLASLDKFKLRARPGDKIGKASDGYKACAAVFLKNSDRATLDKDIDFLIQKVKVI